MAQQNLIELIIRLKDEVTTNLGKVQGGLERVHGTLERGERMISGYTRSLVGMFGAYLGAQGIYALAKGFIDTAAAMESYRTRLEVLLGSQQKANEALQLMNDIAAKSPATLGQVVEAGTTLTAMGADLAAWLPVLNDLAAVMGMDMPEAAFALGRAYSGGAGAADIFRERGILNLIKDFAKLKYGIDDITKLSLPEFRKIMFEAFADQGGRVAGAAAKLATTWDGMISMLADAWERFKIKVMSADVFDTLKGHVQDLLAWIDRMATEGKIDKWANDVSTALKQAVDWLIKAGEATGDWIQKNQGLITQDLPNILRGIGSALKGILEVVKLLPTEAIGWGILGYAFFGTKGAQIGILIGAAERLGKAIHGQYGLQRDASGNLVYVPDLRDRRFAGGGGGGGWGDSKTSGGATGTTPTEAQITGVTGGAAGGASKAAEDYAKLLLQLRDKANQATMEAGVYRLNKEREVLAEIARLYGRNSEAYRLQQQVVTEVAKDNAEKRREIAKKEADEEQEYFLEVFTHQTDELVRAQQALREEGEALTKSLETPEEGFERTISRLLELQEAGAISVETFRRGYEKAKESLRGIADTGKAAFGELINAVKGFGDKFTDTLANMVTTGKFRLKDFGDLAKAVLDDIARQLIYLGITKPIVSGISGWFGGGTPSPGQGIPSGPVVQVHEGGVVGMAGRLRIAPDYLFAGARRLHGGLAADEVPAILQTGETVLSRAQSKAQGGIDIKIYDQRSGGAPIEGRHSRGPDGRHQLRLIIRDAVNDIIGRGDADSALRNRYGAAPIPATR